MLGSKRHNKSYDFFLYYPNDVLGNSVNALGGIIGISLHPKFRNFCTAMIFVDDSIYGPTKSQELQDVCYYIETLCLTSVEKIIIKSGKLNNGIVNSIVCRINNSPKLRHLDLSEADFTDKKYAFEKLASAIRGKSTIDSVIINEKIDLRTDASIISNIAIIQMQVEENNKIKKSKAEEIEPFVLKLISAAKHEKYLIENLGTNIIGFRQKIAAELVSYIQNNGAEGEKIFAELKKIGEAKELTSKQKQFLKDAAKPLEDNFKEIKHDGFIMQFAQWVWKTFASLFYKEQEGNNFKKGYTRFNHGNFEANSFTEALEKSREKEKSGEKSV